MTQNSEATVPAAPANTRSKEPQETAAFVTTPARGGKQCSTKPGMSPEKTSHLSTSSRLWQARLDDIPEPMKIHVPSLLTTSPETMCKSQNFASAFTPLLS